LAFLLAIFFPALAVAQEMSREDEFRALREKKALKLVPNKPGGIEGALLWMQERKIQEKLETPGAGFKGFRPKFGGLSTGGGFGAGFQYDRVRLWNQLDFSMSSVASIRTYHTHDMRFTLPRLASNRLFASAYFRYRSMPQEDYFGPGPDSQKSDRTDYLYEDMTSELRAGVRPLSLLRLAAGAAWIQTNVGHGTDKRFANLEDVFDDSDAPGLARQSDFLRAELSAALDYRDAPGNPHSGGLYRFSFFNYDDFSHNGFDFRRYETEVQQYLPFNHGHRLIAFRFLASFDDPREGQRVPFYMQKTLGGSGDLRGFREFRFRDLNQMVFNLEYRWEAWVGLDMAVFGDAGKVFHDTSEFNLDDLEASYGLGFRFNTTRNIFLRIDIGRSREGVRFFIKFEPVFQEATRW
jgi:outer membrane protein assembly factor BamA